jgi:hypothetical protein
MRKLRWGAGRTSVSTVGAFGMFGLVACAGQTSDESLARVHGDLSAEAANATTLDSGATCDELLARLQNELLSQVSERAEQARVAGTQYYGGGVFIDDVAPQFGTPVPVAATPAPAGASAPAPAITGGLAGFSDTTSLVSGVEDGDFVKAEGDRIYVAQGTNLFVLAAPSAAATELLATVPIEGQTMDVVLDGGHLAVYSYVYGPLPGSGDVYSPYYYYYPSYVKITVLDGQSGGYAVLRESYVEGNYYYSRQSDSVVRTVVQQYSKAQLDYPNVSYVDLFGRPRSQAEIDLQVDLWVLLQVESIEDSVVENYVPVSYERVGGELVRQPVSCGDYLVPSTGLTQAGFTTVVSLDLEQVDAPLGQLTVLGYSDYVYTGADSIVLRQTDYGGYTGELPTVSTQLHRFALDGVNATHTGSGQVSGYVQGTYGLDERDGVIRISLGEDVYQSDGDAGVGYVYTGVAGRVLTLSADTLAEIGRTPDLSSPGYGFSTQFIGDRGYVSITGTTNELVVVDVSDAAAPTVAGRLATPGYTNLLYPLTRATLLGFSQGIDPTGVFSTLALQLIDVSVASAPRVEHELVLDQSAYSEAMYDARALAIHPSRNLIAFQSQNYNTGATALEVVRVSAATGFTRLGSVVPPAVELTLLECVAYLGYSTDPEFLELLEQDPAFAESLLEQCRLYNQEYVRRGLFRGEDVYAIGGQSVTAYALDALSNPPLSQVRLPLSYYNYPYLSPPIAVPIPLRAGPAQPIE